MKHMFPLILIAVCFFSCNQEPRPVNLRFNPQAGKTWSVKTQTISKSVMTKSIFSDTVDFDFDLCVLKADSTGDRMNMLVKNLTVRRSPVNISFTSKPGDNKMRIDMTQFYENRQRIFESVHNDSLMLVITNSGSLKMMDGYDRLAANIASKTGFEETDVRRTIRDYLKTESINDFLKSIFFYLPADDIEKGKSWVSNTTFTALAPVKHSHMIRVDSVMPRQVLLGVEAQVAAGEEGSRYMTGSKKGFITIDKISGLILDMKLEEESFINAPGAERKMLITKTVKGSLY